MYAKRRNRRTGTVHLISTWLLADAKALCTKEPLAEPQRTRAEVDCGRCKAIMKDRAIKEYQLW